MMLPITRNTQAEFGIRGFFFFAEEHIAMINDALDFQNR